MELRWPVEFPKWVLDGARIHPSEEVAYEIYRREDLLAIWMMFGCSHGKPEWFFVDAVRHARYDTWILCSQNMSDPVHLYRAHTPRIATAREDKFVVHYCLDFLAKKPAGGVNSYGLISDNGPIAPVRKEASGVGGETLEETLQYRVRYFCRHC